MTLKIYLPRKFYPFISTNCNEKIKKGTNRVPIPSADLLTLYRISIHLTECIGSARPLSHLMHCMTAGGNRNGLQFPRPMFVYLSSRVTKSLLYTLYTVRYRSLDSIYSSARRHPLCKGQTFF